MKFLTSLLMMIMAFPAFGAFIYPANTNTANVFFGTNKFMYPTIHTNAASTNAILVGVDRYTSGGQIGDAILMPQVSSILWGGEPLTSSTYLGEIFFNGSHDVNGGEMQITSGNRMSLNMGYNNARKGSIHIGSSGNFGDAVFIQYDGALNTDTNTWHSKPLGMVAASINTTVIPGIVGWVPSYSSTAKFGELAFYTYIPDWRTGLPVSPDRPYDTNGVEVFRMTTNGFWNQGFQFLSRVDMPLSTLQLLGGNGGNSYPTVFNNINGADMGDPFFGVGNALLWDSNILVGVAFYPPNWATQAIARLTWYWQGGSNARNVRGTNTCLGQYFVGASGTRQISAMNDRQTLLAFNADTVNVTYYTNNWPRTNCLKYMAIRNHLTWTNWLKSSVEGQLYLLKCSVQYFGYPEAELDTN